MDLWKIVMDSGLILAVNTKILNFAWIVGKSKVLSNCAVKIQNTTPDWRQTWLTVQWVHSILTNGSFYDHLQSDVTMLLWHGLSSCCCLLLTIPRWLGFSIRWLSLNMTSLVECTTNRICRGFCLNFCLVKVFLFAYETTQINFGQANLSLKPAHC